MEAKQRRIQKEEKEAKDAPWKALMDAGDADDEKLREIGGYLEFKELQEYSRENIVIYKRINNYMIRWIISAGKVFEKHGYYFIPIRVVGSPMHKRSTIVYSIIYLELMKFPRSAIMGKEIESIWPFILYLLNNWIRHQFKVMGLVNERQLEEKILERKERIRQEMIDGKTVEEKNEEKNKERLRIRKELKKMTVEQRKEYDKLGFEEKEIKRYEEILNFSSEIEYDDLYDIFDDEFKNKKLKDSKSKEENNSINKVTQKEVYADNNIAQNPFETPFQQFLTEHTVKLPDSQTNRFKLLKNMQAKSYFELHAKELEIETIVLLNEERRKYKKLPPLTPLDYNCIDKAAIKIKTVLDTLSILRKMNGKCLVKRNIKDYSAMLQRNAKKLETMNIICKVGTTFSPELMIAFKAAIIYPEKFNRDQVLIKKSLADQENLANEEIKEVDSDAEQSDKERKLAKDSKSRAKQNNEDENLIAKQMLSMHVGSVEEFLPNRVLFEQGQIKIDEYFFFVNVYFRRFNLDNIESYKDLDKIMHLDVISKNPRLYEGKDLPSDLIEQLERSRKELTNYISFCEIELMSRDSLSHWRDSLRISWEKLRDYFKIFSIQFNPIQFIRCEKFSKQERHIFFNYVSSCLRIENSQIEMDFALMDINAIFDNITLRKESYEYSFFYYNNIFPEDYEYEDMEYDPYFDQLPIYLETFEYGSRGDNTTEKSRQLKVAFDIDDEKDQLNLRLPGEIDDPMLKLTLKTMNPSTGIFLGRLKLGSNDNISYNIRIDFYKVGITPVLEIKICDRHCSTKIYDEKTILRLIKLCNMSSPKFIKNQLKSLVKVSKKISGEFCDIMINKNIREFNHRKQDYINLMLCDELLMRRSIPPANQFQSIIVQESFGRVLASVIEFEIDTEVIDRYNQFSHMYGNKHLDEKTKTMLANQVKDGISKYFEKIRFWKINLHVLNMCKQFSTIISFKDLKFFYETQIFEFFDSNPNIPMPNLLELLGDYLKNIFVYRTQRGKQIYWRFPIYRKPLEMGNQPVINTNQLKVNKIYEMIKFYRKLQDRIDEFNDLIIKEENIPLSLNKQKMKKLKKAPPTLSLRPKYIIETSLPLFNDMNVLTVTSTQQEIVLQRPKYFEGLMYLITITLHRSLECWIWTMYCPLNCRTFAVNFYSSDLFKLPENMFANETFTGEDADKRLWNALIDKSIIEKNNSGDIIFSLINFKSPMKEIMYQNYLYSEQGEDVYFMEITLKSTKNYVTNIDKPFPPLTQTDLNSYVINMRAYSITRNIWIKDFQPLRSLIVSLQKERYISKNTFLIYYSMIRDATVLLAYRVKFSDNAKTKEVKKQKVELDIKRLLGPKKLIPLTEQQELRLQEEEQQVDAYKSREQRLEQETKEKEEEEPYGQVLKPGGERGLKDRVVKEVDLSRILYQMVISLNPMQTATILYNDVNDEFSYRIYRPKDGSVYEKILNSNDVMIACHPVYRSCIAQGKQHEVGKRIAHHFMNQMLIESVLEFSSII